MSPRNSSGNSFRICNKIYTIEENCVIKFWCSIEFWFVLQFCNEQNKQTEAIALTFPRTLSYCIASLESTYNCTNNTSGMKNYHKKTIWSIWHLNALYMIAMRCGTTNHFLLFLYFYIFCCRRCCCHPTITLHSVFKTNARANRAGVSTIVANCVGERTQIIWSSTFINKMKCRNE